jgi:hypothetical protein
LVTSPRPIALPEVTTPVLLDDRDRDPENVPVTFGNSAAPAVWA